MSVISYDKCELPLFFYFLIRGQVVYQAFQVIMEQKDIRVNVVHKDLMY